MNCQLSLARTVTRFLAGAGPVALVVAAFGASPASAAPPAVRCGDRVTKSVVLHADLMCTGDGLTVAANHVTVNLNGHTITGPGNTGVGISAPDSVRVTVKNGTITGFRDAIEAAGSDHLSVTRVRVSGASLSLTGGTGPLIRDSSLTNSNVFLTGVRDASLKDNKLRSTAVVVNAASTAAIVDNSFVDSVVQQGSGGTVVRGNSFTGTSAVFANPDGVTRYLTIIGNRFTGNPIGVVVDTDLSQIRHLTIAGNTFRRDERAGVFLQSATAPAGRYTIRGNRFIGNGFNSTQTDSAGRTINDGLHTNLPVGSNVVVSDNNTRDNAEFGIEALPAGSVIDGGGNTSRGNPAGCAGVHCS